MKLCVQFFVQSAIMRGCVADIMMFNLRLKKMAKIYYCLLCLAGDHCKGNSNNSECECACGEITESDW